MGWKRKRGKLVELNRLLRGAVDTSYTTADVPADVRFVITLDADTQKWFGLSEQVQGVS